MALQFSNFGVSQHMFNIYDGPADEDSNAFLDINKVDLNAKTIPTWVVYQIHRRAFPRLLWWIPTTRFR